MAGSDKPIDIKAVFSEETYAPTEIGVGKHAQCSLLCHKHNFGQTLKVQSALVIVNMRSRSLKSNSLFSVFKQITCIYASLVQKKTLV